MSETVAAEKNESTEKTEVATDSVHAAASAAESAQEGTSTTAIPAEEKQVLVIIYGLMGAGFFLGVTFIAAVIMAYIKRGDVENEITKDHLRFQIRTFWFSLLWTAIGAALSVVVVGYFVLLAAFFWTLYRVIKGFMRLSSGKPAY
jgi:uncharacterized membrane protein